MAGCEASLLIGREGDHRVGHAERPSDPLPQKGFVVRTGRSPEQIRTDTDRALVLHGAAAIDYGLADTIPGPPADTIPGPPALHPGSSAPHPG